MAASIILSKEGEKMINKKNKIQAVKIKFNKWPYIFLMPFVVAYLAFFAFPIGYSLYISMFDWRVSTKEFVGLKNYVELLTHDAYFWISVKNTLIIMLFTIPLLISIGLLLASLLTKNKLRGKRFFQTVSYLPYITTPVAVAIIFTMMFDRNMGIVNKILVALGIFEEPLNWLTASNGMQRCMLVIMLVWEWSGYYMTVYIAAIAGLPADVYEAAKVDGASPVTIFFKITVPLLKNTTVFLVITSVITQLQLFDQPYLLVRGMGTQPMNTIDRPLMTVMTYFMETTSQGRFGYGASITYGLFLLIIIMTVIFMRILKKGEKKNE